MLTGHLDPAVSDLVYFDVRFDFPIVLWPKYYQSFRLSQTTSQQSCLILVKTIQFFVYTIIKSF